MKSNNNYQKHLDLSKRIKIEKGLEENKNFTRIAENICKSSKTVSNEILRNRIEVHCTSWAGSFKTCEKTSKPPYVCNACPSRRGCRKTRYYYYAQDAQIKYEKIRSESRQGINMTAPEFKELNNIITSEINNGHSFSMIVRNNKNEFNISSRTLYNYVEKGYLDIINLDLPRKVRYKKRVKKDKTKREYKYRINRTYEDFKDYVKNYNDNDFNINIVEMDTVEGIKGESLLLTLLWRFSNFMLAIKIEDKKAETVNNVFLMLKEKLGYERFHMLFPIILTDNEVEFSSPDEIEYNGKHVFKTRVFYCDPGSSNQKGKIEVNHEYIRRYIPKKNSFDQFNQDDINLMMNHINSVKRESLNNSSPYELTCKFLPTELINLYNIKEINQKDIILKDKLLNKKR